MTIKRIVLIVWGIWFVVGFLSAGFGREQGSGGLLYLWFMVTFIGGSLWGFYDYYQNQH